MVFAHEPALLHGARTHLRDALLQGVDAGAVERAYVHPLRICACARVLRRRAVNRLAEEVCLVADHDMRNAPLLEEREQVAISLLKPAHRVDDEHRHVAAAQHLAGLLHATGAERAGIVDTGRVDDDHRP